MKPLLCFDVDGTLRDNVNHQVCLSTQKTLQLLKKKGYHMMISSGRGLDSLTKTGLMDMFEWDGFVCNNGQRVLDANKHEIFHALMDPQAVLDVLDIAEKYHYAVTLKSTQRVITKEPDAYVLQTQRYFQNQIPPVGTYHGQDVEAMIVYGPLGYDYAPFQKVKGVHVLPGESTYADITIAGLSKATGIQKLMHLLNLDEYIAFGDSLNDVDMFQHASQSVAMGQGNEQLKSIATFITKPIDEDGIYYACLQLGLIEEGEYE